MRSWVGSRIREDSLRVPCRYCNAAAGEQCVTKDRDPRPLEAFPAHAVRTSDALKQQEES